MADTLQSMFMCFLPGVWKLFITFCSREACPKEWDSTGHANDLEPNGIQTHDAASDDKSCQTDDSQPSINPVNQASINKIKEVFL